MFDKQQRKLKRSAKLISVLSKYGFKDILARMNISKSENPGLASDNIYKNSLYERIRMALEELGPTFVKFGQSFSNREDLLPPDMVKELQKLQDKVEEIPMDIASILESEFGIIPQDFFSEIDNKAIATASIAQIHRAKLADGKEVILKIRKPGVEEMIKDDLLLLHDVVQIITSYTDLGEKLNLKLVIATYEKSLLEEISLINEKNNILQFALNFKDNPETYVPEVYTEFSNNNVLCMEYIDGIKITDVEELTSFGISPKKISEVGLRLYVSQILDYGFFHADPHAGNILVKKDGRIVFIDFGAVGQLQPNDKEHLEKLISAFVTKNAHKIVRTLKSMSLSFQIPNEEAFQNDVDQMLNYIHSQSLREMDTQQIILKMRDILKNNRIHMPAYFYILFKGIGLIEGVGRSINPDLDIVGSLRPYSKKILMRKFSPKSLISSGQKKIAEFADNLEEIPNELRSILYKLDQNKFTVSADVKTLERTNEILKNGNINLVLALFFGVEMISGTIFQVMSAKPLYGDFSLFAIFSFFLSIVFGGILILRIIKKL